MVSLWFEPGTPISLLHTPRAQNDRDSTADGWEQTLDAHSSLPVEGCSIFWGGMGPSDFSFPQPSYLSKKLKSNEFVHEVGGSVLPPRHTHTERWCLSSFSGWRFHSSQGLDKGKPERSEIATPTLLRWWCHSERGYYPRDRLQICCPGGETQAVKSSVALPSLRHGARKFHPKDTLRNNGFGKKQLKDL